MRKILRDPRDGEEHGIVLEKAPDLAGSSLIYLLNHP